MTHRSFVRRTRLEATAEEAFRWHARPGAFERLNPPWDPAVVESRSGGIEDEGARVVLRVGPLRQRWVAEHHGAVPGHEFHDRQVRGPFALWEHAHRVIPEGPNACTLEDRIEYALPAGAAGDLVAGRAVRALLDRMFAYRHRVTADDLAAHAACREGEPMKVVVTGASGLLGSALVPFLTAGGHEVVRLVRRAPRSKDEARWDPEAGEIDAAALEGTDAVVHLAGENIAGGRWTEARKALLRSSRVGPTELLARALAGLTKKPKVLVSASAIGYYGNRGDAWVTEKDAPAADFLGRLSVEWEAAAEPARKAGIRVVHPRFGIVLSPAGGALGKMLLPFKAGLGGVVGPGTQYMSWIALDDVLGVVHHLLDRADLEGPVNAAAPEPVTNAVFTKTLGRVLGRPTVASVPAFALRLALGEMADAALLSSTRVRPERLQASGYRFRFPDLEGALRHVLGKPA
ncbi:MAG TPA: TIGR01777 family oxidoreductase [Vicinamibacteria bacterium]|nr:TIGR01777 family oxidoreductase [Vicinamibacteria bacterium]